MAPNGDDRSQTAEWWEIQLSDKAKAPYYVFAGDLDREP